MNLTELGASWAGAFKVVRHTVTVQTRVALCKWAATNRRAGLVQHHVILTNCCPIGVLEIYILYNNYFTCVLAISFYIYYCSRRVYLLNKINLYVQVIQSNTQKTKLCHVLFQTKMFNDMAY